MNLDVSNSGYKLQDLQFMHQLNKASAGTNQSELDVLKLNASH